jgi:hypothetical protein
VVAGNDMIARRVRRSVAPLGSLIGIKQTPEEDY